MHPAYEPRLLSRASPSLQAGAPHPAPLSCRASSPGSPQEQTEAGENPRIRFLSSTFKQRIWCGQGFRLGTCSLSWVHPEFCPQTRIKKLSGLRLTVPPSPFPSFFTNQQVLIGQLLCARLTKSLPRGTSSSLFFSPLPSLPPLFSFTLMLLFTPRCIRYFC